MHLIIITSTVPGPSLSKTLFRGALLSLIFFELSTVTFLVNREPDIGKNRGESTKQLVKTNNTNSSQTSSHFARHFVRFRSAVSVNYRSGFGSGRYLPVGTCELTWSIWRMKIMRSMRATTWNEMSSVDDSDVNVRSWFNSSRWKTALCVGISVLGVGAVGFLIWRRRSTKDVIGKPEPESEKADLVCIQK